jgi:hypothetical protein
VNNMKKLYVQFFALPHEVAEWVDHWCREYSLKLAGVRYFPNVAVTTLDITTSLRTEEPAWTNCNELWLGLKDFEVDCEAWLDLVDHNRDCLSVRVPKLKDNCLTEISVGSATANTAIAKVWRQIINYIHEKTEAGMWGTGPSGAAAYYEHARYSLGVAEETKKGLALCAIAGTVTMSVGQAPQPGKTGHSRL